MSRFIKCVHGGGSSCKNQGGDGCTVHGPNYMHKHVHVTELDGVPSHIIGTAEGAMLTLSKSLDSIVEDESIALEILSNANEAINKSIYYFDFDKYEGYERVLELLPVLDTEVVKDIYATVFPNYPVDDSSMFNPRMARLELRGFFMDFLANNGPDQATQTDPTSNETGKEAINSTLAYEARNESPASEAAA